MIRIRGVGRLRETARRIKNRFTPSVVILMYHRVVELPSDPYSLCVTPLHFTEHLETLRQHNCRLMSLQQLNQSLRDGNLPYRGVVVTFDDGYVDNLYNAKPLLERYDIPATVFIASGSIGQKREFWWDELERLLLQPGTLPQTLELNINGSTHKWELGEDAHYTEEARGRARNWHLGLQDDPSLRHCLFRSLHQLMGSLQEPERTKVLNNLLEWAGTESIVRLTHRTLSPDEVAHLAEEGLVEIGAHTVTHPFLSSLPIAIQQDEIRRSKTDLEEILGYPVASFAYPHGRYTPETVAIVREAEFACACSSIATNCRRDSDNFLLPRHVVNDWDGETFASRLSAWFRG